MGELSEGQRPRLSAAVENILLAHSAFSQKPAVETASVNQEYALKQAEIVRGRHEDIARCSVLYENIPCEFHHTLYCFYAECFF